MREVHCYTHGLISILNNTSSGSVNLEQLKKYNIKSNVFNSLCNLASETIEDKKINDFFTRNLGNYNFDSEDRPLVTCKKCIKIMKEHGL